MDLKKLLQPGRVVELDGKKMGVVDDIRYIKFSSSDLYVSSFDNALEHEQFGYLITKIYENTPDGLQLIWDRKDYVDWSKVEVDTKILVRDNPDAKWKKQHFAKYENGKVYAWCGGKTSWTIRENEMCAYIYAKLYQEDDADV